MASDLFCFLSESKLRCEAKTSPENPPCFFLLFYSCGTRIITTVKGTDYSDSLWPSQSPPWRWVYTGSQITTRSVPNMHRIRREVDDPALQCNHTKPGSHITSLAAKPGNAKPGRGSLPTASIWLFFSFPQACKASQTPLLINVWTWAFPDRYSEKYCTTF